MFSRQSPNKTQRQQSPQTNEKQNPNPKRKAQQGSRKCLRLALVKGEMMFGTGFLTSPGVPASDELRGRPGGARVPLPP